MLKVNETGLFSQIPIGAKFRLDSNPTGRLRVKIGTTIERVIYDDTQLPCAECTYAAQYRVYELPQENKVMATQTPRFFILAAPPDGVNKYSLVGDGLGYDTLDKAKEITKHFARNNSGHKYMIVRPTLSVATEVVFTDLEAPTQPVTLGTQDVSMDL
jgi:hypothetical protein